VAKLRHSMWLFLIGLALVLVLAVVLTRSAAGQDAQEGYRVAKRWCASCHIVEGRDVSDTAPSFAQVANDPAITAAGLRTWLSSPHSSMPDFNLSRGEIDQIIAYIESLKAN